MASNLTLQSVVNFCSTHADLLPLSNVGGYTQEPALSLCNDALADLLMSPRAWKFNQADMTMLVTLPNKQDYVFAGASAFVLGGNSGGAAIDLASNEAITQSGTTTTVKTLEPHRFKVGDIVYMTGTTVDDYNAVFTDDGMSSTWSGGWVITLVPTPTSFVFEHTQSGLAISGAPGITDFGWLEAASMVEMNNNSSPQRSLLLSAVRELQPWSMVANPEKVSVYRDNGDGTLVIRFKYVPGSTIWGAKLIYQKSAPIKTSLAETWAPFPDQFSSVYRQAVMSRMYRYLNSSRTDVEYQKLQGEISKFMGEDDNESSDIHICPEEGSFTDGYWGGF